MRKIQSLIGTEISTSVKAAYLASKQYCEPVMFDFSGAVVIVDAANATIVSNVAWVHELAQRFVSSMPIYDDAKLNGLYAEIDAHTQILNDLRRRVEARITEISLGQDTTDAAPRRDDPPTLENANESGG